MSTLSETDWQLLNAYHDDELPPVERSAFERRLKEEPALDAELQELRAQSAKLKSLRPRLAAANDPVQPRRRLIWTGIGALAASLALAFYLGAGIGADPSPAAIHAEFTAASQGDDNMPSVASGQQGAGLPDLTVAGLVLVATRSVGKTEAAHYAGPNGCRATLLISDGDLDAPGQTVLQFAEWAASDRNYMLLSEGMDQKRFGLIVDYLRGHTSGSPDTVVALQEAIGETRTCT
ncbi:hypothetical protein EYE42_11875 [Paracoccus subflavus]|uniref:Anti-sigma factor n=1 Tax=Paracoccus subflavus TaxID=2528244 RepID=A0A4Q9FYY3_9RHOB|nr:hypothetical protein [Paracoccus subflavus]TBN38600.1 hypothetical protein EYE42_11875 [Paracoccus subflavus]